MAIDSDPDDPFNTLDDYSLVNILEKLNQHDLTTVGSIYPRVRQLIAEFGILPESSMKESRLLIIIGLRKLPDAHYYPMAESDEATKLCTGFECILNTLKVYCYVFNQLDITLNYAAQFNSSLAQRVVDYASDYCSTTVQKVQVQNVGDSIAKFTASSASIVDIHRPEKLKQFSISRSFPRVERLSIRIDNAFAIAEHLPHLKHLELVDKSCENFDLKAFAAMNPQVNSVKLDLCNGIDSLREVNAIFPHLEALHYAPRIIVRLDEPLRRTIDTDNIVRFRNVKNYTIGLAGDFDKLFHLYQFPLLQSIHFDQLESLKYISLGSIYGKPESLDFVTQYTQLRSLDCSSYGMSYDEVWRLVLSMPSLRKLTFRPRRDLTYRVDILRMMAETDLETIRVWMDGDVATLRNATLPDRWVLSPVQPRISYSTALTFTRK